MCLDLSCQRDRLFLTRDDWVTHLSLDHHFNWKASKCPLCHENMNDGQHAITRHLWSHLEEIALAALPSGLDQDSDAADSSSEDPFRLYPFSTPVPRRTRDVRKQISRFASRVRGLAAGMFATPEPKSNRKRLRPGQLKAQYVATSGLPKGELVAWLERRFHDYDFNLEVHYAKEERSWVCKLPEVLSESDRKQMSGLRSLRGSFMFFSFARSFSSSSS
ncbi:hypothetical protein B0T17DRAFT_524053 [Bombardia bombarda]|uniref:Uncharacterized protein n=1 Tax=Bombardia bombarda TaxID=252184 RepID=A0AA39X8X1_9PEZI|nr:hypothetical protein B0T17DRAFT_524053 [Bombardia bombarda]